MPGETDGAFARKPLELGAKPSDLGSIPPDLANDNSEGLASETRFGRVVEGLDCPIIHDLQEIEPALQTTLEEIASGLAGAGKVPLERMRGIVLRLCSGRYMTLSLLAELLHRDETHLRQSHLSPMAEQGVLARAFPQRPNDPRQAYLAKPSDPAPKPSEVRESEQ